MSESNLKQIFIQNNKIFVEEKFQELNYQMFDFVPKKKIKIKKIKKKGIKSHTLTRTHLEKCEEVSQEEDKPQDQYNLKLFPESNMLIDGDNFFKNEICLCKCLNGSKKFKKELS